MFVNNVKWTLQLIVFCHMYIKMLGLFVHLAQWLSETYLQCGTHMVSVIKFNVYSGPCYVIHIIDFIYSMYVFTQPIYSCQIYGIYMYNLGKNGMFVSGTYMVIICEIKIGVCHVGAYMQKKKRVRSTWTWDIRCCSLYF